ncbi:MAG: diguanylate cyclase [Deltaproteobacteria bacterium RIFOXYD12_FULL_56_24]|nr:MAG: diguanylate cyclase [Deltaproteobacteria bacterium RIFOXYD12_FULL_56_24]
MFSMDFIHSIRFRLLASLFVLLGLSISVSMYGIWVFERDRYMVIAQSEATKAGQTIEKALRSAMLQNNRAAIQKSVDDIHAIVKPSVISILSYKNKVEISSDKSMLGRSFDRDTNASCTGCHITRGVPPKRSEIFLETEAGPVLRNVIKIPNGPECYGCHSPEQQNCGILLYDVLFTDTIEMLHTVLVRMALTGLISFVFLILVLSFIIQRYVHRPVNQLMEGFIHVGQGDFNYWVDVNTKGEFQEMADLFNVMGHAIQRSFAKIKEKNWETTSLYAFVQQLSRAIEWTRLRRLITELLQETFKTREVVVFLSREKQEQMVFEVSWRQTDDPRYHHRDYALQVEADDLPFGTFLDWEKWRNGELTDINFSSNDTRAVLPLVSKNISLGLVCLQREAAQPFSGAEKQLVFAIREQLAIALANARLYRLAITDGLTELYTRRYCETAMRKLREASELNPEKGFCVLMLDIDHFKQVNDTHGHQVGDEVLIQLADLIRASIRQDDVACRYGGEEFIMLISGNLKVGRESALRLRRVIENHLFISSTAPPLRNTVSIGVASFPLHGKTCTEVIGAADQALYEAKEQGRNRVVCFEDESGIPANVNTSPENGDS